MSSSERPPHCRFAISGPTLPVTLGQGQSVTVNVTFTPQSAGTWGGLVAVFPGIVIPLTGTASTVGQLVLAPAPLNFGDVTIGKTATQSLTLSATGGSVTVSSAGSGSSQFVLALLFPSPSPREPASPSTSFSHRALPDRNPVRSPSSATRLIRMQLSLYPVQARSLPTVWVSTGIRART
jgi:hypothetical protein